MRTRGMSEHMGFEYQKKPESPTSRPALTWRSSAGSSAASSNVHGYDALHLLAIETAANTKMTRLYGRAPIGARPGRFGPARPLEDDHFVADWTDRRHRRPPASSTSPMDGPSFLAYVEQAVAPCSRPGDVVLMDNVSAPHKGRRRRERHPLGRRIASFLLRPTRQTSTESRSSSPS